MSNFVFISEERYGRRWQRQDGRGIANTKDIWKGHMGTMWLCSSEKSWLPKPPHPTESNVVYWYCSWLPTEHDGKAVLLKALNTLVIEHGRNHMVLTRELPLCSLNTRRCYVHCRVVGEGYQQFYPNVNHVSYKNDWYGPRYHGGVNIMG